jgi:hypothetical protein
VNAITPVSEIAEWLHGRTVIWRALAVLKSYFDESDTHGEASATSIAGYVATEATWNAFEADWAKELARYAEYGVTTFHMAPCLAGYGEFSRLDSFWRNQLVLDMGRVLERHDLQPVWSAVVVEDWGTVTDKEFLARYPKPFDLCFEHTIIQLWEWAQETTSGERVAPMFAITKEYLPRMAEIGAAYLASDWYGEFLAPIAFGRPSNVLPLQAADFMAHEASEQVRHLEYDVLTIRNGGPRYAYNLATKARGAHVGGYFDAKALASTVRRFKETGTIFGNGLGGKR